MIGKILYMQQVAKAGREVRLTKLIRAYVQGKISKNMLLIGLKAVYDRRGEERRTILPGENLGRVTGVDPVYMQVYDTIVRSYPLKQDLREDQVESFTNTVSARAATTERLQEYQRRGVQMVEVVAYIDDATTDICRAMNGRVFEIGPAAEGLAGQGPLVHSEGFWEGNHHFSQTPTAEMSVPWLPPYHYNCRTRVIPFIEPVREFDQAMKRYQNLEKLEERHVEAIMREIMNLNFGSQAKLRQHVTDHKEEFGISSTGEYMRLVKQMVRSPMNNAAIAISKRNGRRTLYLWSPRVREVKGLELHDFSVYNLDANVLQTFHAKSWDDIMKNLDTGVHSKVMWLRGQEETKKGDRKMVGEYEVERYKHVIKYLESNDDNAEIWMMTRFYFEDNWEGMEQRLKERIMEVDREVLERFGDWYDDSVFKEYKAVIRKRIEEAGGGKR